MDRRDRLILEARKRGILPKETISARPGFLERALPATGQIAGGIGGALLGAPTGPGGAYAGGIAGATAGATAGRGAQQFLRARRGERFTPQKVASELGTEAVVTGTTEALMPVGGRVLRPAGQFLGRRVIAPSASTAFRFMTNIHPEYTEHLIEKGPRQILKRQLRSREGGIHLAEKFLGNAKQAQQVINQEWESKVAPLRKNPASVLDAGSIRQAVSKVEESFGLADAPALQGAKDVLSVPRKVIRDVRKLTESGTLHLDKALQARQQLDDVIYTKSSQGLLSPRHVTALKQVRASISDAIHSKFGDVAEVDAKKHVLSDALDEIERFDPNSASSLDRLGRLIDRFEDTSPAARQALYTADEEIQRATGKSLIGAIKDRSAAMAFEPLEIRAVRSHLIMAVLSGMGLAGFAAGGPAGAALSTMFGTALATPRLAGEMVRGTMFMGRRAKDLTTTAVRTGVAEGGRQKFLSPRPEPQAKTRKEFLKSKVE